MTKLTGAQARVMKFMGEGIVVVMEGRPQADIYLPGTPGCLYRQCYRRTLRQLERLGLVRELTRDEWPPQFAEFVRQLGRLDLPRPFRVFGPARKKQDGDV